MNLETIHEIQWNLVVLEVVGGKFSRLEIEHLFAEIWLEMLLRLCEGVKVTIDLSTYSLQLTVCSVGSRCF